MTTHTQPAADAAPSKTEGAAPPSLTADEIAALRADSVALAALKAEQAQAKAAARDAAKAAQAEAEKAGETVKALEAAKARLAELEADAPLAARWRDHEAAETKRLDERAAKLPDTFAALYKSAPDMAARAAVLAAYDSVQAAPAAPGKTPGVPPAMGAPASTAVVVDFASAVKDPAKWEQAKAQDPKGAASWFRSLMQPRQGSATPTFARDGRA